MVERYNNKEQIDTQNTVSSTTANGFTINPTQQLVKTLDGFLSKASHMLDRKTVIRAKKAGALAGLDPNFATKEGESLAAEAFNNAGIEIFINKTIVDVSTTVDQLQNRPDLKANPSALRIAAEDVGEKMMSEMPIDAIPDFAVAYNRLTESAVQSAQRAWQAERLAENKASFEAMEQATLVGILNAARDGDQEAVMQWADSYGKRVAKAGPVAQGGTGILSVDEVSSKMRAFSKTIEIETITGEFLRTPDVGKPAYMEALVSGSRLDQLFTPEEQTDVIRYISGTLSAREAESTRQASKEKEKLRVESLEAEKKFVMDPSKENLTELMKHPHADSPFQYMNYYNDRATESNPLVLNEMRDKLERGELKAEDLSFTMEDGSPNPVADKLSPRDRRGLMEELVGFEQGSGFETTPAWKETMRRVDEDYGKMDTLGRIVASDKGVQIRRQVYDQMVEQWPKYMAGQAERPDPIKLFNSAKSHFERADADKTQVYKVKNTEGEDVVVPNRYVEDPLSMDADEEMGMLRPEFKRDDVKLNIILLHRQNFGGKK